MNKVQALNGGGKVLPLLLAIAFIIAALVALLGIFQLGNGYRMVDNEAIILGFSLGMVATLCVLVVVNGARYRRMLDAISCSRARRDGIRMVLDAAGLTVWGTGHQVFQSWSIVEKVVVVDGVTLIMPSRVEFYPLPHSSLPPEVTPDELARRIANWREAVA